MSKSDFPALRMIVENGRLAPATEFDQERVNSYRRGAIVLCRLNEEKDRVLVRKWFAILTLVVKQCQTPWKTKEEASEAIKLALGIVNLSKTVGGNFMQYPKSLTELDDPEMTDALEQMIELLGHMTGVDVETLKKEAADVGRDIEQQDSNSASADPAPSGQSPNDEASPASSNDGGEVLSPSASPPSSQSPWLVTAARMLLAATHAGGDTEAHLDLLNSQRKAVPVPDEATQEERDRAGSMYRQCKAVVLQEIDPAKGKALVASYAGCDVLELEVNA